jgi:hypothetical protein
MDQQADLAGALVVIPKLKSEADYREFLPGPFYKFARTRSLIRALLTRLPLSTFNIPAQYFPNQPRPSEAQARVLLGRHWSLWYRTFAGPVCAPFTPQATCEEYYPEMLLIVARGRAVMLVECVEELCGADVEEGACRTTPSPGFGLLDPGVSDFFAQGLEAIPAAGLGRRGVGALREKAVAPLGVLLEISRVATCGLPRQTPQGDLCEQNHGLACTAPVK